MSEEKPKYDRTWGDEDNLGGPIRVANMADDMINEVHRAASLRGHIRSRHELLGILHEEWAEVCDVIHTNGPDESLRKELVQLGAMCLRAAYECNGLGRGA